MQTESGASFVRQLVAAVSRPSATPDEVAAKVGAAGFAPTEARINSLAEDRVGVEVRFGAASPARLAVGELLAAFGPGREGRSLHGDEPPSINWDVDEGGGQHVIVSAELGGAPDEVTAVTLTPYYLEPDEADEANG